LAQPAMHAWGETLRLEAKARAKDDAQPKALACSGLLRTDQDRVLLRFVEVCRIRGRPLATGEAVHLCSGQGHKRVAVAHPLQGTSSIPSPWNTTFPKPPWPGPP
jgi:hypothetical protein